MSLTFEKDKGGKNIFELLTSWVDELTFEGRIADGRPLREAIETVERSFLERSGDTLLLRTTEDSLVFWYALTMPIYVRLTISLHAHLSKDDLIQKLLDLKELFSLGVSPTSLDIERLQPSILLMNEPQMSLVYNGLGIQRVSDKGSLAPIISKVANVATKAYELEERMRHALLRRSRFSWEIVVKFKAKPVKASSASFLLWALAEALELVPDVFVTVEDCGTGSIWVKCKVFMKGIVQKKEVRELLEKSRDALIAEQLDQRIGNAQKIVAEKEKLQAETQMIEQQLRAAGHQSTKYFERASRKLDLDAKRLANEHQHLENRLLELKLIEHRANLIREGIGLNDPVQININGAPYLAFSKGKIKGGAPLDQIEIAGEIKIEPQQDKGGIDPQQDEDDERK